MSSERIRVVRDVDALHVAWLDDEQTHGWAKRSAVTKGVSNLTVLFFCLGLMTGLLSPYVVIPIVVGIFAFGNSQARAVHQRLSVTAEGIVLQAFYERRTRQRPGLPSKSKVGNPARPFGLFGGSTPSKKLAFVDIAELGHTDFTLWFVDDEGHRTEIELPPTPLGRMRQLHEQIQVHWASKRSGVKGPVHEARAQRARLSALAPQDER